MAVISPIQPTSALNIQPSTPIDHLDKNTPAATPTDQQDAKSTTASPYVAPAPASVEPASLTEPLSIKKEAIPMNSSSNVNNVSTSSSGTAASGNNVSSTSSSANNSSGNSSNSSNTNPTPDIKNIIALLKRPSLTSRDYENIVDDDYMPHQLLYDYSTLDAWYKLFFLLKLELI